MVSRIMSTTPRVSGTWRRPSLSSGPDSGCSRITSDRKHQCNATRCNERQSQSRCACFPLRWIGRMLQSDDVGWSWVQQNSAVVTTNKLIQNISTTIPWIMHQNLSLGNCKAYGLEQGNLKSDCSRGRRAYMWLFDSIYLWICWVRTHQTVTGEVGNSKVMKWNPIEKWREKLAFINGNYCDWTHWMTSQLKCRHVECLCVCLCVVVMPWSVNVHALDEHGHVIKILLKKTNCLKCFFMIMVYCPTCTFSLQHWVWWWANDINACSLYAMTVYKQSSPKS